jgi:hypothetical protein
MTQESARYGVIILARLDPRLTRATLASLRACAHAPDHIVVVIPAAREHLFADLAAGEGGAPPDRVIAGEDEALSAGISALAPHADIALLVPEGIVFEPDYVGGLRDEIECFEDLVGGIDLVHRVAKIDTETEGDRAELDARDVPREWPIVSTLRGLLAARSLLGAVLWVRMAALGQIKFAPLTDGGEVIAFALALDQLRARGRTGIRFTRRACHLRLVPERRSGHEAGHQLYRKLGQVAEAQRAASALRGAKPTHLDPRIEQLRLFLTQALRALVSPANRHHATTFLQGALAARREARSIDRTVKRELRDML